MENVSLQQIVNRLPLLNCKYFGSLPSDYVPILPNGTVKTQPSKIPGERCEMIANCRHKLYFADYLGPNSALEQQYKQMMPELLNCPPSICGFYTIYEAFDLFRLRQVEITGFHNVNVISSTRNYM